MPVILRFLAWGFTAIAGVSMAEDIFGTSEEDVELAQAQSNMRGALHPNLVKVLALLVVGLLGFFVLKATKKNTKK